LLALAATLEIVEFAFRFAVFAAVVVVLEQMRPPAIASAPADDVHTDNVRSKCELGI